MHLSGECSGAFCSQRDRYLYEEEVETKNRANRRVNVGIKLCLSDVYNLNCIITLML